MLWGLRLKMERRLSTVFKINWDIVFCGELVATYVRTKEIYFHLSYSTPYIEIIFFIILRKVVRKPSTNSSLSLSSSPSTATRQPKSLMTIIKGGHKSSVFSTSSSATNKTKSTKNEDNYDLTKEEYEQLHASLPWFIFIIIHK